MTELRKGAGASSYLTAPGPVRGASAALVNANVELRNLLCVGPRVPPPIARVRRAACAESSLKPATFHSSLQIQKPLPDSETTRGGRTVASSWGFHFFCHRSLGRTRVQLRICMPASLPTIAASYGGLGNSGDRRSRQRDAWRPCGNQPECRESAAR